MFELRFKIFGFRFTLGCERGLFVAQLGPFAGAIAAEKYEGYSQPFGCHAHHEKGMKKWRIGFNKYVFEVSAAKYLAQHHSLEEFGTFPDTDPVEVRARQTREVRGAARA